MTGNLDGVEPGAAQPGEHRRMTVALDPHGALGLAERHGATIAREGLPDLLLLLNRGRDHGKGEPLAVGCFLVGVRACATAARQSAASSATAVILLPSFHTAEAVDAVIAEL